eukprot:jgi/Mesen1/666/ME000109S10889
MPAELPGFYYDSELNRYFRLPRRGQQALPSGAGRGAPGGDGQSGGPGRIRQRKLANPAASGAQRGDTSPSPSRESNAPRLLPLLSGREVTGGGQRGCRVASFQLFQRQLLESQAACPIVWEYESLPWKTDGDMLLVNARVQDEQGEGAAAVLFFGGTSGSLGVCEASTGDMPPGGSTRQEVGASARAPEAPAAVHPSRLYPEAATWQEGIGSPPVLWRLPEAIEFTSQVSAIRQMASMGEARASNSNLLATRVIVATLGAGAQGGTLYVLENCGQLALQQRRVVPWAVIATHAMESWSVWTAECHPRTPDVSLGEPSPPLLWIQLPP